jgi:hypothetical protein
MIRLLGTPGRDRAPVESTRGLRAGGDDDVLGVELGDLAVLGRDLDLARTSDLAPALDPVDLVLLEQEFHAFGQLGDAVGLLLHHGRQVQIDRGVDA